MKLPMPKRPVVAGVLASFDHIDAATDAIRSLKSSGHRDLTIYTASPNHEVEEAMGYTTSPVRLFTLIGGLTGCAAGFAMTIWMARDWPILTGGKPIVSIPPFVVIAFELTILIGALATLFGVAVLSLLKAGRKIAYDPRFTDDRIGVFVAAKPAQAAGIERMFREAGAVEVTHAAA
jgi:ActD protein